jgi:hypothetical protein
MILAMAKALTKPLHLIKATGAVEIKASEDLPLSARRLFDHLLAHAYPRMKEVWDKAQKAAATVHFHSLEASESPKEQERAVERAKRMVFAEGQEHSIPMVAIRRYAAEARDGYEEDSNSRLKAAVSALQRVLVQFDYLQSDGTQWQSTQLLGPSRITDDGILHYSFQLPLMEKLIEPALYSYISLRVVYQCDSKYTLILYQVLKRYADRNAAVPYWQVTVTELRDILGCSDKLKDWKDFRRSALNPAIEEIAQIAEFSVELNEIRQGRGRGGGKVIAVVFQIRKKAPAEATETVRVLDRHRLQRRVDRKNGTKLSTRAQAALAFMNNADSSKRIAWIKRAEALGVKLPQAAAARENLARWVPAMASAIIEEEGLTVEDV